MRLRAEAPRVTRISRRVLAGLGLVAGIGIGGALIYALQTADRPASQEELFTTDRRQTADGLQGLPSDYSGIPQLGPPLPGDLGGPIVRAREEGTRCPGRDRASAAARSRRAAPPRRNGGGAHQRDILPDPSAGSLGLPTFQPTLGGQHSRVSPVQERRIGNSPSSTPRSIAAPSRPIASRRRHHPSCCRPAR